MVPRFTSRPRPRTAGYGFSLIEVVIAVGIFAVAILSIVGLLAPNSKLIADQLDANVAQRLGQNIQLELQRYGFDKVAASFTLPYKATDRIYMVATKDGSRVLVTGEDPYKAWNDTYLNYKPENSGNYSAVTPASDKRTAENDLDTDASPGNPPGMAFRDRYFLIEVSWPLYPQYNKALGILPLAVRVLWPYRLPDGPANPDSTSKYNDFDKLPWRVVPPAEHSALLFNVALTP